ncbi:hypothetical protein E2542_SST25334 [Spatholobus suberectus]|nr:hypothetical protein E2542_SST25334 [Spatholobus suberectus]
MNQTKLPCNLVLCRTHRAISSSASPRDRTPSSVNPLHQRDQGTRHTPHFLSLSLIVFSACEKSNPSGRIATNANTSVRTVSLFPSCNATWVKKRPFCFAERRSDKLRETSKHLSLFRYYEHEFGPGP